VFVTPPDFIVTAPELTLKSSEEKDAIPLLLVLASSPAIVIVLLDPEVLIPVPPVIVKVSLSKSIDKAPPESPCISKSCAEISDVSAIVPAVEGRTTVGLPEKLP
jgi:hypothetical protein